MPSMMERFIADNAIKRKGYLWLGYNRITDSSLPTYALINALLAQGWEAAPESDAMRKKIEVTDGPT